MTRSCSPTAVFPTQGDLDSLRAVEEKEETLETFCRQLQGALADTPVTLSVMGQRDSVTADPVSGQTTALLATFGPGVDPGRGPGGPGGV